jgi:D-alanyl-D-alanine carboxypeptidase (penicillin-binding protein 5/6)
VVAEAFAGSEEAFSRQMTERGRALGLTNTTFMNASGWPHPEHLMTVRDLARLAEILIEDYPEYYSFFAEREFVFSDIRQYSRNPLLGRFPGADGLKTGYTDDAGYGVTASASRDGRRLIMVIAGLDAARQRAGEAERLLEYGFREFKNYRLFEAGQVIDSADIWLGEPGIVPLIVEQEVHLSLTRAGRQKLEAKVVYDGPIPAPVQSGSTIAHLELTAPDFEPRRLPLVAGAEIEAVGLLGRFTSALGYLIWGSS